MFWQFANALTFLAYKLPTFLRGPAISSSSRTIRSPNLPIAEETHDGYWAGRKGEWITVPIPQPRRA